MPKGKAAKKRARKARERTAKLMAAKAPAMLRLEGEGQIEIQAAEHDGDGDDKPKTFTMVAYTGGRMFPRFFTDVGIVVDLSGVTVNGKSRPVLLGHDPSKIVGHTENIQVDRRITASGVISGVGEAAKEVIGTAENGFPWRASIGALTQKLVFVDDGEKVEVNGRKFTGPLYIARKIVLGEISFVPLAADDKTSARVAASEETTIEVINMKFEAWLEARGFNAEEISDEQRNSLKAMWQLESSADTPPAEPPVTPTASTTVTADGDGSGDVDTIQATRDATADEIERQNNIRRIAASYEIERIELNAGAEDPQEVDLVAHAIRENWNTDRVELEAMRAARPGAPAIHSRSLESDGTLQAMQGAMLLRAGLQLDNDVWQSQGAVSMGLPAWMRQSINAEGRQRAMEAAHRYSDLAMVDLCAHACRLDGNDAPVGRKATIQAAMSGGTLANIFTTNVNAALLATYLQAGDTTAGWVRERDVPNFKTNERTRMTIGADLTKHKRGQAADHHTRSDIKEEYKIARYSKKFVVDEQDIIDDSMNALMDMPVDLGNAAARLRPDLVYSILLANAALSDSVALFHTTHNNLQTSAALADGTLKTAIAAVEKQQENNVSLNLRVTHLIVPSDLKHTAAGLIRSATTFKHGSTDTTFTTENTIATVESLNLVSDARMANGVTDPDTGTAHAGSATTWFIGSSLAHTIEVGYLLGSGRVPQVVMFRKQGEDGEWTIGWAVKLDIGAKALDFRGLNKSTG